MVFVFPGVPREITSVPTVSVPARVSPDAPFNGSDRIPMIVELLEFGVGVPVKEKLVPMLFPYTAGSTVPAAAPIVNTVPA
jgi:hypothetical protein